LKRKIYFRADAGTDIGYGHFIRTLALADILKDRFDCYFVTNCPTAYQLDEIQKVCFYQSLPHASSHLEAFLSLLNGNEIVVLDNYFFSTDYQRRIKEKGCKLVCIDDMHDKHYVADIVINHSLGVTEQDFSKESYTRLYLGLSYALLRKPFLDVVELSHKSFQHSDKLNIVLSFGGADCFSLTWKYIECLKDIEKIQSIVAIIGDAFLIENAIPYPKVSYRKNLSAEEMVALFCSSDLAILPSSSVMKEALACGIVVIGGYFVENQLNSYHCFQKQNAIIGVGDYNLFETMLSVQKLFLDDSLKKIELRKGLIPTCVSENLVNIFRTL
jgi:hypothetical protein